MIGYVLAICLFVPFMPKLSFAGHLGNLPFELTGEVGRAIHYAEGNLETAFRFKEVEAICSHTGYRTWFQVNIATNDNRFDIIGNAIVDWTFRIEHKIGTHFYSRTGSGILVYIDFIVPGNRPYLYWWKHPNYGSRMIGASSGICQ